MKKSTLLTVLLSVTLASCIMMKPRITGDGSSSLNKNDSLIMSEFVIDSSLIEHKYVTENDIRFQVIDAHNLLQLIMEKPFNWIYIGSSWCPISDIAFRKYTHLLKGFSKDSIQFIYINQDYNLSELKKMIIASSLTTVPYLLDIRKYGTKESQKQVLFMQDLGWGLPMTLFEGGGVPKSILTYHDKQIIYYASGPDINQDTIVKYTNLKYSKSN